MVQIYIIFQFLDQFTFHMNYIIVGTGALVNEAGAEGPLKADDFALVNPGENHQYRSKGDKPFKMMCGVPKEFDYPLLNKLMQGTAGVCKWGQIKDLEFNTVQDPWNKAQLSHALDGILL